MKLINEAQIVNEWAPQLQAETGINESYKLEWMSKYCHFHSLNESYSSANFSNTNGMGAIAAPANPGGVGVFYAGGSYNGTGTGSGDKFPSLLPLAIQVAKKTIGFDIVNVIPMSGPTGILTYLDMVYTGGRIDNSSNPPLMIKANLPGLSTTLVVGTTYFVKPTGAAASNDVYQLKFVGYSQIDADAIFSVTIGTVTGVTIATAFNAASTYELYATNAGTPDVAITTALVNPAQLVSNVENHIAGYSGAGYTDTDNYSGPFTNGTQNVGPMGRATGETQYARPNGLKTFTKFVEAETYQESANVTIEQIQDLNKQYGIDVVSMVENNLINNISQSINKHITSRAFALGWSNHREFAISENGGVTNTLNLNLSGGAGVNFTYVGKDGNNVTLTSGASAVVSTTYENTMTLQRKIADRILAAGNIISHRGNRGPANFIVCGTKVATAIQSISQFTAAPFANTINQSTGSLYPAGTVFGMTLYVDPTMAWNDQRVLVGRKGADEDPGLKFMPYMMAETVQTIAEGTMSPKILVKSRYALVEAGHHPQTMYFTFVVDTVGDATAPNTII